MKTIFRTRGFDSIIGKGMVVEGDLHLESGGTLLVEGTMMCNVIDIVGASLSQSKRDAKTTLRVSGTLRNIPEKLLNITVNNVVITGLVECDEIKVDGTLAVKRGAKLQARKIHYRELVVETGAIMLGEMIHLDQPVAKESTSGDTPVP